MAAKSVKETVPDTAYKTAEEWAAEKAVPGVYLAGMKYKKKWAANKMVAESEFDAALNEFLSEVAGGRKK